MIKQKGFTLIEVMIAVAILAIIYSGLMVATNKTFKGWWALRGSLDLTQKASDALYWISRDFKNAKASSLGNIASNPGLEDPQDMSLSPTGWENSIVSGGYVQRISSADSPEVRGGVNSIQLSQNTTAYFSDVFTIPETKQYVVSGWVKAGGGMAGVRLVQADKTDFAVPVSMTSTNNYWVHAATSSVLNTGQQGRLKLDFPSPTWHLDYTRPLGVNVRDVLGLCVFQNKLYAYFGSTNYELYVNDNGTWGLGYTTSKLTWTGMAVHNGKLYVIYTDWPNREVSVYDGATLSLSTGFQTSPQYSGSIIYVLRSFNGVLYAGGSKWNGSKDEPVIFQYDGVSTWSIVYTEAVPASYSFRSFCVYNDGSGDKLFVGSSSGKIYVYDGISWAQDFNFGWQVRSISIHNNKLYAAIDAFGPSCNIYVRNTANNWVIVPALTGVMKTAQILWSHNGLLYIGGTNSLNQATIVVYDFINPPTTSFTTAADVVNSFATYKNKLYASTLYHQGGIFVLGGENYFDDISVSPVEVDTTTIAALPYEYSSAVAQNNSSGNQWRRYRLRYVPKNAPDPAAPGELYREYTLDGANWVAQGLLSSGALCDNVKSFKIINRNQESFAVELTLEKEISTGVKKEYVNYTTITPIVP